MAGASNSYGLTAQSVLAALGWTDTKVASPGLEALEEAIQEFSGRVNTRLKGLGIRPELITAAQQPDFYNDIRGQLKQRLKYWWHAATNRNPELESDAEEEFAIWLRLLREAPTHMVGDADHQLKLGSNHVNNPDPTLGRRGWVDKRNGFQ